MGTDQYLILMLVKNLNEGDGASLSMIDYHFFRVINDKNLNSMLNDNDMLLKEIEQLVDEGFIYLNHINNYGITDLGEEWIKNNSGFKVK